MNKLLLLPAIWVFGLFGLQSAAMAEPLPDIHVIVLDALRPDHLGCYGYHRKTSPNIDKMAAEGLRFTNAVTTSTASPKAHASLFTSFVDIAKVTAEVRHSMSLINLLQGVGYRTAIVSANAYVGPIKLDIYRDVDDYSNGGSWFALPPEEKAAEYDRQIAAAVARHEILGASYNEWTLEVTAKSPESVFDEAFRLVEESNARDEDQPLFMFVNVFDPHDPYLPPKEFDRFRNRHASDIDGAIRNRGVEDWRNGYDLSVPDLLRLRDLYDGEILCADHYLGQYLKRLERTGRLDNSVVFLLSDHGEMFCERGGYLTHGGRHPWPELMNIPLIMVDYRDDMDLGPASLHTPVTLCDVPGTIWEIAGIDPPHRGQGRSLFRIAREELEGGIRYAPVLEWGEAGTAIHGKGPVPGELLTDPNQVLPKEELERLRGIGYLK